LHFDVQILSHTTEDPMAILMQCIKTNIFTEVAFELFNNNGCCHLSEKVGCPCSKARKRL